MEKEKSISVSQKITESGKIAISISGKVSRKLPTKEDTRDYLYIGGGIVVLIFVLVMIQHFRRRGRSRFLATFEETFQKSPKIHYWCVPDETLRSRQRVLSKEELSRSPPSSLPTSAEKNPAIVNNAEHPDDFIPPENFITGEDGSVVDEVSTQFNPMLKNDSTDGMQNFMTSLSSDSHDELISLGSKRSGGKKLKNWYEKELPATSRRNSAFAHHANHHQVHAKK